MGEQSLKVDKKTRQFNNFPQLNINHFSSCSLDSLFLLRALEACDITKAIVLFFFSFVLNAGDHLLYCKFL